MHHLRLQQRPSRDLQPGDHPRPDDRRGQRRRLPERDDRRTTPVDLNGDGFPDAVITITPRSNLNLLATTTSLTLTAKTLPTSLFAGQTYQSSAVITVTGGSTGGGGGANGGAALSTTPVGTITPTFFLSHFGPDIYVPSIATFSQLNTYKPIPLHAAIEPYLPGPGFAERLYDSAHPDKASRPSLREPVRQRQHRERLQPLPHNVFFRTSFKKGKTVEFSHKVTSSRPTSSTSSSPARSPA